MGTEFVDAYAHCGISKYKPLADVEAAMRLAHVDRAVLVQHLGEFDNGYIQRVVDQNPQKFSGVCLVDHSSSQAVFDLERWAETGSFRGVRLVLEGLETNPDLWRRAAELNLNMIVYAPTGVRHEAGWLDHFLRDVPDTRIILSHLALGNLSEDGRLDLDDAVYQLAEHDGVYFQVSGMHMFCDDPFSPLEPLIGRALKSFGADRMLWGGNYPVVGTDNDYAREADLIRSGGLSIPAEAIRKITSNTALKIWF